ncbi:MAG: exodeoxyribonuclease VII large subunit [Pseudomonadota bacterium]
MTETPASNIHEYTVSELSGALKRTVEDAYGHVRVRGELGRVTRAKSGHLYLDMKDERAVIDAVMWKGVTASLAFKPEEGLEVIAEGRLSTFPGRSKYQLIIERMEPAGAGALMALLEERKKKLAAEGLFSPDAKSPLPFLPQVVGVVTSPTGAVIRDILHRIGERFPRRVLVWPVLVQGEKAPEQIVAAIKGFNAIQPGGRVPRPDLLIVARGGGSVEDLWGFNEEAVVRAAFGSDIPLISAVGHETDTTLIDFASDIRAPTPTAAAEMAVPVRADLLDRVETAGGRLAGALVRAVRTKRTELDAARRGLPRPQIIVQEKGQALEYASGRFTAAAGQLITARRVKLERAAAGLRVEALRRDVRERRRRFTDLSARLRPAGERLLSQHHRALLSLSARLEALSHKATLKRGFALVRDEAGELVRSAAALKPGQAVSMTFADGERSARMAGGEAPPPRIARPKRKAKPPSPDQGSLF